MKFITDSESKALVDRRIATKAGPDTSTRIVNADKRSASVANMLLTTDRPNVRAIKTRYKSPPMVDGNNWFKVTLIVFTRTDLPRVGNALSLGMNLEINQRHLIDAGMMSDASNKEHATIITGLTTSAIFRVLVRSE